MGFFSVIQQHFLKQVFPVLGFGGGGGSPLTVKVWEQFETLLLNWVQLLH